MAVQSCSSSSGSTGGDGNHVTRVENNGAGRLRTVTLMTDLLANLPWPSRGEEELKLMLLQKICGPIAHEHSLAVNLLDWCSAKTGSRVDGVFW